MKKIVGFLLLFLNINLVAQTDEGFDALFNGKDLDNWTLKIRSGDAEEAKKVFSVSDGMVHVFKDYPDSMWLEKDKGITHGMMYTKDTFSRFIFRFEYKWGTKIYNNFDRFQYDAGMYYHVYNDKIFPMGIEYQVRYNHVTNENHTGDFWAANTFFD